MKSFTFLLVAAFTFGMPVRAFAQSVQWAQGYPKAGKVSGTILVKGSVTLGANKLTSPVVKVYTWRKNDNDKGALVSDATSIMINPDNTFNETSLTPGFAGASYWVSGEAVIGNGNYRTPGGAWAKAAP